MLTSETRASQWLAVYNRIDAALVVKGWPATSPWWRQELERFIRSGKRRWVIRAGRRAGKSSTLCRAAICQGIAGGWSVPPGDVAVVSFTSLDRDEASSRIRTIREALTALGIEHQQTADEIFVPSKRLAYRVTTCSIRAVGFTAVMLVGDEMARWESRDTAANPAKEVMASQRPTMATQPFGIEVDCSSPWGDEDYHAQLFSEGDNDHQQVSFAPSWIANPTLTEHGTHELEPDERIWSREYAAIPSANVSQALDRSDLEACIVTEFPGAPGRCFCCIDASSLRGDAFAWLFVFESPTGLLVPEVRGIEGDELRRYSMLEIVQRIAGQCKTLGCCQVFGDQREAASLESMFNAEGLAFTSYAWSETSKDSSFMTLRRVLRDRQIKLIGHKKLTEQLRTVKAHLRPSGRTYYATNGLDYLSALITAIHAVDDNQIQIARPPRAPIAVHCEPESRWHDFEGFNAGPSTWGWGSF